MSNLLEKALIIGFGIFILTLFFSISAPYLEEIGEYNNKEKQNLNNYIIFVDEIRFSIDFIIDHPDEIYTKKILYPENVNLILKNNLVKFELLIDGEIQTKILEYNEKFVERHYINLKPIEHYLYVYYYQDRILVEIN